MRVALINSVCGIRSTGRIMAQLASAVENAGGESLMIYGRETVPTALKQKAFRMESELGVRLHALQARIFDSAGFGSKWATGRLLARLDAFRPDVLHLHNLHGYYIHLPTLFAYIKQKKIPTVMTLHDCWTFTGHCSHYDYVGCQKWRTGCAGCPQKGEYPTSWWLDRSSQNYERKRACFLGVEKLILVTPSAWLAEECKQSFLRQYPVEVIHNGIDLFSFKPTDGDLRQRFGLEHKKILLAVASAWEDGRKGFDDVVQLAGILPDDCQVVMVGVAEKQKKTLPRNVLGITRTNDVKELAQWYTAADVFINPTYEDTYPTVNLEAIACGTPVVTYPSGGSTEAVISGVTGYVTERQDVAQLAKMSLCAMELKEKMSGRYAEAFDNGLFAQNYLSLYRKLCREKG